MRSRVEFIIGRGESMVMGEIGLIPRSKKVIELAVDEGRRFNHHYTGTEHLLLGLLREGEGIAAGVLESLGVGLDTARAQVIHSFPLDSAAMGADGRLLQLRDHAGKIGPATMPGREACAPVVTIKPMIDRARLLTLLREQFDGPLARVRLIRAGQLSQAFSFAVGGHTHPYVIRLNASAEGFERDRYAWQTFVSADLPIPRIVAIGQVDELHFAISERAPGRTMTALPAAGRRRVLPLALDVLDRIHQQDVRDGRGFGHWERLGVGRFASWRDYLAAIIEDETTGFHRGWHALFRDSFLERDVFELVYAQMLRLADYCPEDRSLLHGDYGFDNLLTDGRRITGVIDWANIAYGDPLYEIAWLCLFYANPEVDAFLLDRYGCCPNPAPHYAERVACYQCRIGLDGLRFFARTNQPAAYRSTRDRIVAIAERVATAD